MPIGASAGTLDIENATLRSNAIVVLTNLVTGNDAVRSLDPPNLEVYGDPSQGGTEPTLELVSNVDAGSASAFTRLTSNAGVFSIQSGTDDTLDSKGDIVFSSIGGDSEHMRIVGSTGRVVIGNVDVSANLHMTTASSVLVDSNVVAEYTGPHDRPLRKYPEVAMTANDNSSTSGYVASGSSRLSASYEYYEAFDNVISTGTTNWISASSTFDGSGDADLTNSNTFPGTSYRGEYCALKLPNAIKLDNFHIFSRGDASSYVYSNPPKDLRIFGSNDGTTWTHIKQFQNLSFTGLGGLRLHVNDSNTYNEYAFFVEKITVSSGGATYCAIGELAFYGYEEGSGSLDTTLKSVYNVPATTGTQLEVYYDAKDLTAMPSTVTDLSPNTNGGSVAGATLDETGGIESFKFDGNDYISTTVTGLTGTSVTMSVWVNVNSIDTSRINSIVGLGAYPGSGSSIWIAIDGSQRFYTGISGLSKTVENSSAFTNNWVHLTMTIGTGELALYQDATIIGKVSGVTFNPDSNPVLYLGTRSDGSGNPESTRHFNGSIANFRLYSKVLNADQVKELYDYQKDYFLGSKSQVTLYKGHLGVGVTEPSGQLELAGDERIQEYPPRGLVGDELVYDPDGNAYDYNVEGHGVFKLLSNYKYHNGTGSNDRRIYKLFDKSDSTITHWTSFNSSAPYDAAGGSGAWVTTLDGGSTITAHIAEIQMPYKITLKKYILTSSSQVPRALKTGMIVGSNDGNVFHMLHNVPDFGFTATSQPKEYTVDDVTTPYRIFRLLLMNTNGHSTCNMNEWRLFGTPGPTTLDKGSLSLTRSLDVPRVSRYDVDTETPRPEKLVVDFDTTVNSSPTDISGKGNHGTFNGGAYYSAADKAFSFDGTDDIIYNGGIGNWSDNISHTFSFWFKCESVNASNYGGGLVNVYNTVSTTNHYSAFSFETGSSGYINFYHFSNDFSYSYPFELNTWYHVAGVYSGSSTTQKVYVDGVDLGPGTAAPGSDTSGLLLGTNPKLSLGGDYGRSDYYFDGQISNFKLYNVALEPSEVQKLYRLGRTGRSMVISDTAVGIGKVPEAQLDVRGTISATSDIQVYSPDGISKIRTGKVGMFFQNSGRTIDPDTEFSPTRPYSIWESNVGGEGSYIAINGDNIVMCSPCDDESLRYYDEDNGNEVWNISNAGALVVGSDSRRKHDIKPVIWENVLKKIGNIEPSTFKFKTPESYTRVTSKWDKEHIGFIAQNVQENFPELVTEDGSSENYLLVNSSMMILPIIQGIQQLTNELEAEKAKNEALEARITALESA